MSDDFIVKTKYECKYCHKLFATTKHECKWNPSKKNCLTCKHCVGLDKGKGDIFDNDTLGFIEHQSSYFMCDKGDMSDFAEMEVIYQNHWNGYCEGYEQADCDNFRKRYADIMVEQRNTEAFDRKYEYHLWRGIDF